MPMLLAKSLQGPKPRAAGCKLAAGRRLTIAGLPPGRTCRKWKVTLSTTTSRMLGCCARKLGSISTAASCMAMGGTKRQFLAVLAGRQRT